MKSLVNTVTLQLKMEFPKLRNVKTRGVNRGRRKKRYWGGAGFVSKWLFVFFHSRSENII